MGREGEVRKADDFGRLDFDRKSLHIHPVCFLGQHSVLNVLHFSEQALLQHLIRKLCLKHKRT